MTVPLNAASYDHMMMKIMCVKTKNINIWFHKKLFIICIQTGCEKAVKPLHTYHSILSSINQIYNMLAILHIQLGIIPIS